MSNRSTHHLIGEAFTQLGDRRIRCENLRNGKFDPDIRCHRWHPRASGSMCVIMHLLDSGEICSARLFGDDVSGAIMCHRWPNEQCVQRTPIMTGFGRPSKEADSDPRNQLSLQTYKYVALKKFLGASHHLFNCMD